MERWIRLNCTWSQTEWVADLDPECRLVWIELMCHAKAFGVGGRVKALSPSVAARLWGVTRYAVTVTLEASRANGALEIEHEEDGSDTAYWVLTGWAKYQGDDTNAERQRRYRQRRKQDTGNRDVTGVTRDEGNVTTVTRYGDGVTPTETETETETETGTETIEESTTPSGQCLSGEESPDPAPTAERIPFARIVNDLNAICGTSFKATTEATRRLIRARWREGHREQDFGAVIRHKHAEWAGDEKMTAFLRPQTLFGTKFESYLQETKTTTGKGRRRWIPPELRE